LPQRAEAHPTPHSAARFPLERRRETVASAQSNSETLAAGETFKFESRTSLDAPQLWSLDEPNLYRLSTHVYAGSDLVDQTETPFGIRSPFASILTRDFFSTKKPVKIKGTCNHQDHAGVGTALPDRLHYYRLERLKEMGSNVLSHIAQSSCTGTPRCVRPPRARAG
jgi:beta-galactosidase